MPVDIARGIVSLTFEDASIPGHVPLVWERRYSTGFLDRAPTPLGWGWTCRYYATLALRDGNIEFGTPEGSVEIIPDPDGLVASGGVARNMGACVEIFRDGERYIVQRWNVDSGDVQRYGFNAGAPGTNWKLSTVEDVSGRAVAVDWDEVGRLRRVRQLLEGRALSFAYTVTGLLADVVLESPNGEQHLIGRYEYDDLSCQTAAHDPADSVDHFEYDRRGRLVREVVKDGGVFIYRYDYKGRCVLTTGLGRYHEKRLRYLEASRITEVTDSYDRKHTYQHLPSGQAALIIDPLGAQRTNEYDAHGRVIATTDGTGATTRFQYDDSGNRSATIDALGNATRVTYNADHQPLVTIDAGGQTWHRVYDGSNRLIHTSDPMGNQWTLQYDDEGNTAVIVNPKGDRKQQRYHRGILQSVSDWAGNHTGYSFDAFGRVVERRGSLDELLRFRYDLIGNLIEVRLPNGATLSAEYDKAGNLISYVNADGQVTRWHYGACNRLLTRSDPVGGQVRYVWGTEPDWLERIINEQGEEQTFERDGAGHVIREVGFDGTVRQFRYNAEGRTIARVDGNGETTLIERDALQRVVGRVLPDGERETFVFDTLGNLVEAVNADATLRFERDPLGRIVREIRDEYWVASGYDAVGNLLHTETSLGHVLDYGVDANGALSFLTAGSGQAIAFERDAYGQETARVMPGGARMEQRFDELWRLADQRVSSEGERVRGHGGPAASDLVRREFTYTRSSALVRTADVRWGSVDYSYDPAAHLLYALRERGTSERFEYDLTGNVTRIHQQGQKASDDELVYGEGNRLTRKGTTEYVHDGEGRRIKKIEHSDGGAPRVWSYQWNGLDRLTSVTRPDGQVWHYRYDALGRRTAKVGPPGVPNSVRHFVWDKDVVVHEATSDHSVSTWIFERGSFAPLVTFQDSKCLVVINDHLGTPRELIDETPRVVWARTTKSWGDEDASTESSGVTCPIAFQGQWIDAESGLHYSLHRYYDPKVARFISTDPLGLSVGLNLYLYAQNPISWVDPLGLQTVTATFEHQGQTFTGTNPTDRDPRPSGPTVPGLRGPNIDRADMHAEIESMMKAHDAGQRGGNGTLTISGLEACPRCKGDIKTMARALDLDSLTVHNNGQTITFTKEELKKMKEGGKGWKGGCGGGGT